MERLPTLRLCAMNSRTAVVRFIATRTGSKPIPLLCTACVIDTHPPHGSLSLITLLSVPPALFLWRPKGKVFFKDTVKSAASVSVLPLSVSPLLGIHLTYVDFIELGGSFKYKQPGCREAGWWRGFTTKQRKERARETHALRKAGQRGV